MPSIDLFTDTMQLAAVLEVIRGAIMVLFIIVSFLVILVVLAQEGSPLPGVTLTLARSDGAESRLAATGEKGVFRLPRVAPGTWELSAASPGFAPRQIALEDLRPGESRHVTITLPVAAFRETVEVVGIAPRGDLEASRIRESNARDVGEALGSSVGVWKLRKGGIANDIVVKGYHP